MCRFCGATRRTIVKHFASLGFKIKGQKKRIPQLKDPKSIQWPKTLFGIKLR